MMPEQGSVQLAEAKQETEEILFDHYLGALLGGAIADALGWITEFRKARSELDKMNRVLVDRFITWSKPTGGRFHTYTDWVNEGEYSDDTQLTLCTARSLEADGTFNPTVFTEELAAWLDYARGAGAAITAAARHVRTTRSVRWNSNFYGEKGRQRRRGYVEAGGNGAAMRVAPHALANRDDSPRVSDGVWRNAVITHGHPRAVVGALTFAEALRVLTDVESLTKGELLSHLSDHVSRIVVPDDSDFASWAKKWELTAGSAYEPLLNETKKEMVQFLQVAGSGRPLFDVLTELGCFKPSTKGSGTGCVAAAIAAFLREPADYQPGVLSLINTLGIDTDTIGAMYGSLVGVRGRSTRIPELWSVKIQDYEYFISVADALTKIALRTTKENPLRVDTSLIRERESSDIVDLARDRRVTKGQRVIHGLLGPGWVSSISEQTTKSGSQMLLADVMLDSGQSVKFRASRSQSQYQQREMKATRSSGRRTGQRRLFGSEGLA